jgi:hypothetical protein
MYTGMREDWNVRTQPDADSDALSHSRAQLDAHACPDLDAHAVSDLDAHAVSDLDAHAEVQ